MNRINNLIDAIYCEEQSNHMHTLPSPRTTQFEDQAKTVCLTGHDYHPLHSIRVAILPANYFPTTCYFDLSKGSK